jgi:hypothetical protein
MTPRPARPSCAEPRSVNSVQDADPPQGGGDLAALRAERLREALRLIGEKGSAADVEEYKRFVVAVAQAAAEAHTVGGLMGIGGEQISAEEQPALDDFRGILDAQPTTPQYPGGTHPTTQRLLDSPLGGSRSRCGHSSGPLRTLFIGRFYPLNSFRDLGYVGHHGEDSNPV